MAAFLSGQPLAQIPVGRAMSKQLWTCRADAPVEEALAKLCEHQVHRLAVVDGDGVLIGVLSLSDLALAAKEPRQRALGEAVLGTLIAVKKPRTAGKAEPIVVLEPAPRRAKPAPAKPRRKSGKA
jgi:predicted transcriptional regulator